MNRKDKITEIESTEGLADTERLVALRSYENERMHPTNVRLREDKENAFKNVETAYNEGNYQATASLIESNRDILDDEFVNEKVEEDSKLGKIFKEGYRMVGTAVESTLNNVFEVTDDIVRLGEKYGLPNLYIQVKDGEVNFLTERPEDVNVRPLEFVDDPDSMVANLGAGFLEFMIPFTTMLKATKAYKGGNAATNVLKVYGSGAVADFMFSPQYGNFASLLSELGIQNEFIQFLDSRVDEEADIIEKMKGRGKGVIEGVLMGAMFDTAIKAVRYMKQSPEWVAKAKSYLSANFDEAGAATSNIPSSSPAADKSLSEAGLEINTSPTDTPSSGTNLPPSQETTVPGPKRTETISPSNDLGNNSNLSAISIKDKIYQVDNDINTLLVKAKENKPKLDEMLNKYDADVVTDIKQLDSINTKLNVKNREPKGLPDYLRAFMLTENTKIQDISTQIEKDLKILDKDYNNKTRSIHYQIEVAPGFTSEVQLRPKEIHPLIKKHHKRWYSLSKKYDNTDAIPLSLQIQILQAEFQLEENILKILGQ
jgi:hypothetical protein